MEAGGLCFSEVHEGWVGMYNTFNIYIRVKVGLNKLNMCFIYSNGGPVTLVEKDKRCVCLKCVFASLFLWYMY